MTIRGMAALSCLAVAAALAGCSSGSLGPDKHAGLTSSVERTPPGADYAPSRTAPRTIGRVVTTQIGETLYTFDRDQDGKSNCYDNCARQWPPLIATDSAKPYWRMSLTSRTDGRRQWAYDGKPLYTYVGDTKLGDIKGDNVGDAWHVIR